MLWWYWIISSAIIIIVTIVSYVIELMNRFAVKELLSASLLSWSKNIQEMIDSLSEKEAGELNFTWYKSTVEQAIKTNNKLKEDLINSKSCFSLFNTLTNNVYAYKNPKKYLVIKDRDDKLKITYLNVFQQIVSNLNKEKNTNYALPKEVEEYFFAEDEWDLVKKTQEIFDLWFYNN